jgi:putative membrane-bound dehydrogenase-like protein
VRLFPAAFTALAVLSAAVAAPPGSDVAAPQSPPRPIPEWLTTPSWFGHTGQRVIDQGRHDPRLKGYVTPEGIKVEIVADFPTVVNPVGMAFADDGTPFVLEWRSAATPKQGVGDAVKVLRDSKGSGVYDESSVVLEDDFPSGLLLHDGWLYLSGRGTVRRYRQGRAGGPYDVKEVIAKGFGGLHHHQVSGLTIGNDGWLYVTCGSGDHHVEGPDGSRATVLRTGAVFRCRPDGSRMHTYAIGFCNPYRGVAFDAAYNVFHADNDGEGAGKFTGCRLMHVAEGNDFGWRLLPGEPGGRPDPVRAAVWGELPGKVPPLLKTGRGAPAGLSIYNDARFPEHCRGLVLYPDARRRVIRAYRVEPRGAGFEVTEEFELLSAADDLFRPCQAVAGPDGAIYVVDGRGGDGKHGRIYRLTWAGTRDYPTLPRRATDSWLKVVRSSDDDLIAALGSPDFSDRERARAELVRRGPRNSAALGRRLADVRRPLPARIAALGALQSFWSDDVAKLFLDRLNDPEPDVRRLAADAVALSARRGDRGVHDALLHALNDPDPAVRRSVVLAMGRVAADGAADVLANVLAFDDGKDVYLHDGIVRAVEQLGARGVERLLALADSGVAKDLDKVVAAFTAFRTRAAADAVPTLLKNPHLSIAQRAALLRSYGNYLLDPPVSVEPVLVYVTAHPEEPPAVKLAGLEALSAGGGLKSEKARAWVTALLKDRAREPAGARGVGEMFLAGKLAREQRPQVIEALRRHADKDPEAAKMLAALEKQD